MNNNFQKEINEAIKMSELAISELKGNMIICLIGLLLDVYLVVFLYINYTYIGIITYILIALALYLAYLFYKSHELMKTFNLSLKYFKSYK